MVIARARRVASGSARSDAVFSAPGQQWPQRLKDTDTLRTKSRFKFPDRFDHDVPLARVRQRIADLRYPTVPGAKYLLRQGGAHQTKQRLEPLHDLARLVHARSSQLCTAKLSHRTLELFPRNAPEPLGTEIVEFKSVGHECPEVPALQVKSGAAQQPNHSALSQSRGGETIWLTLSGEAPRSTLSVRPGDPRSNAPFRVRVGQKISNNSD